MERSAVPPETRPDGGITNAFGAMQAFGDMWAKSSQAFFEGQQKWFGDLANAALGERKGAREPDLSGLKAAQAAYSQAVSNAMNMSRALMKSFGAAQGASGDAETSLLPNMFDPQAWSALSPDFDGSLARLQEGPQLADAGLIERKFAAVYAAMAALRQRSLEHQMVMTNAWARAANGFAQRLSATGGAEKGAGRTLPTSWRELTALWIEAVNDELIATQRTEAYLTSQRNLLKASTDLRLAQQEIAAFYAEMFGLPTRAEIDDVHKSVTEMRRELRALQRSLKPVREHDHG
jgi:hypothetical protein